MASKLLENGVQEMKQNVFAKVQRSFAERFANTMRLPMVKNAATSELYGYSAFVLDRNEARETLESAGISGTDLAAALEILESRASNLASI